jgi:shikimate kinase
MKADFDLRNLNVYLIGMMGSGKSTTGRLLAQALGYQLFDTDQVIEQAAGQMISEIFADAGEAEFRKIETQVLSQLSAYTRLVVATGGGIILERRNWSYLQQGLVVWLEADVPLLLERLTLDTSRPLLQTADPLGKIEALLRQRQSLYAQADLRVYVRDKATPEEVVNAILTEIPKVLLPRASTPPNLVQQHDLA